MVKTKRLARPAAARENFFRFHVCYPALGFGGRHCNEGYQNPGRNSENIYCYYLAFELYEVAECWVKIHYHYPALGRKEKIRPILCSDPGSNSENIHCSYPAVGHSDELWLEVEVECGVVIVKYFTITTQR